MRASLSFSDDWDCVFALALPSRVSIRPAAPKPALAVLKNPRRSSGATVLSGAAIPFCSLMMCVLAIVTVQSVCPGIDADMVAQGRRKRG